jgi:hypothetical protein
MLVILDPGFFREADIKSGNGERRARAERRLTERLEDANRLLARRGAALIVAVDRLRWFDEIWRAEVRPIEEAAGRPLKQALARLREHHRRGRTLPEVAPQGNMWGISMMAEWPDFGRSWREALELVVSATVHAGAGEGAVFLCHRILGRNAMDRSSATIELTVVMRWRLTAALRGAPTTVIPCVGSERHIDVAWTRRMDDRLPDAHGTGLHPYCPPAGWRNAQTRVWGTQQSRPCWLDARGQGWARPAIADGYHWDVYVTSEAEARIGLGQINVTRFGAPAGQGHPGDLHHIPTAKRGRLRDKSGWDCP